MTGEHDLNLMLTTLKPLLLEGTYVFTTFPNAKYGDHADLKPIASFQEFEGLTLIIPESVARDRNLPYDVVFKGVTLGVHSSLEAVGLTAAISRKLTECGISANVIAAYFHDHVFVPSERALEAMQALDELRR